MAREPRSVGGEGTRRAVCRRDGRCALGYVDRRPVRCEGLQLRVPELLAV